MPAKQMKLWPLVALTVLVCGAGNFVGGFFGLLASVLYAMATDHSPAIAGILLGGSGGLLAGVTWCVVIIRRILRGYRQRRPASPKLILFGILWGFLVAMGTTLVLHAGLMIAVGRWQGEELLIGLGFGATAGVLTGALAGLLAWAAAALAKPTRPPAAPT